MIDHNAYGAILSPRVVKRLQDGYPCVAWSGYVVQRAEKGRKPSWRVRFQDRWTDEEGEVRVTYRSIELPSEDAARAVERLLKDWRAHEAESVCLPWANPPDFDAITQRSRQFFAGVVETRSRGRGRKKRLPTRPSCRGALW